MRWEVALFTLATFIAYTQTPPPLHLDGVVVDTNGKPIVEASIDHTGNPQAYYKTDGNGRFAITTRGPIIVVRKLGFQSQRLRVRGGTQLRVTLQKSSEEQSLPLCENRFLKPAGLTIQFERIPPELNAKRDTQDVDYTASYHQIQTGQGIRSLVVGRGHSWSWGGPSDRDIWNSVEYSERIYGNGQQITFIDARGKYANGDRWRSLSAFGESASYHDADQPTAKIFDLMLDSGCTY